MNNKELELNCGFCAKRYANIFSNASEESINEMNANKSCSFYKKGNSIIQEDAQAFGIYCINTGKVKLVKTTEDGYGESIVRLAKEGDIFGYKAMLTNNRFSASAIALEDSHICFIPKDVFISVLKKDAALSMELLSLISNELKNNEERLTHLANKSVRERAAETLLLLKEKYGFEADGETINLQMSRLDLSNIIGTATESTIRLLSEFKKSNLIELKGKKIALKNIPKLAQIAKLED